MIKSMRTYAAYKTREIKKKNISVENTKMPYCISITEIYIYIYKTVKTDVKIHVGEHNNITYTKT